METMYTVLLTGNRTDYYWASSAADAIAQARLHYDGPIAARKSMYGEWECGGECPNCKNAFQNSVGIRLNS
jgi:hypothetical protein